MKIRFKSGTTIKHHTYFVGKLNINVFYIPILLNALYKIICSQFKNNILTMKIVIYIER